MERDGEGDEKRISVPSKIVLPRLGFVWSEHGVVGYMRSEKSEDDFLKS